MQQIVRRRLHVFPLRSLVFCTLLVTGAAETEASEPGIPGARLPGDCNGSGDVDLSDAVCLLGNLFLGNPEALPCGDGTTASAGNRQMLDWNSDGVVDLSDPVSILQYLFVGGPAHVLGGVCTLFPDCPETCATEGILGPIPMWPPDGEVVEAGQAAFSWDDPTASDGGGAGLEPEAADDGRVYNLSVWEVRPGEDIGPEITLRPADVSVAGIDDTFLDGELLPLLPGDSFVWQVEVANASFHATGELGFFSVQQTLPPDDLKGLLDRLNKMRKDLEKLGDDIEDNPLVEEARFLAAAMKLIDKLNSGEITDEALEALRSVVNCDLKALDGYSVQTVKGLLEILEELVRIMAIAEDSPTTKKALKRIADTIARVRKGLEGIENLKSFEEHLKKLKEGDFSKYIDWATEGAAKDIIKKAIEREIARVVGAKAAGAIVSIASDLYHLFDLISKLSDRDELEKEWNKLLEEIICKAAEMGLNLAGFGWYQDVLLLSGSEFGEDDTVKLTPKLLCWQPEEGATEAGCGEWVACEGSVSVAASGSDCADAEPCLSVPLKKARAVKDDEGSIIRFEYDFKVCLPDSTCTQGPCLLVLCIEKGGESFGGLLLGVIKETGSDG